METATNSLNRIIPSDRASFQLLNPIFHIVTTIGYIFSLAMNEQEPACCADERITLKVMLSVLSGCPKISVVNVSGMR